MMLVSIGKPMMDILVEVDNNFLNKYGVDPNDSKKATESQAELFKEILRMNPKLVPGGSVTNTLRVFQWALGYKETILYLGAIGKDDFGIQIKQQLEKENINYMFLEKSLETPQCAVLISNNGKNRSLISNSSLRTTQTTGDTNIAFKEIKDQIAECNCFYVPAYSVVMFFNIIKDIIEYLTLTKKKIVVNLGATYIIQNYSDEVKYLIKHADVIIGNTDEYQSLGEIYNISSADVKNKLEKIKFLTAANKKDTIFIVTSAHYDIIAYENGSYQYFKVTPVPNIVDTTAAGDAFAAGFLTQYLKNLPLKNCIHCGMACAKHIIQHVGCDFDLNFDRTKLFHI